MPETTTEVRPEFREGAVRIVRETGKPIAQVARDLESTRARSGTGWPRTASSGARRNGSRLTRGPGSRSSNGRMPSCEWSVMSSSDPWSCRLGSRRDERGVVCRVPEDRARYSRRLDVSGVRQRRQADLDAAVKASFEDPSGNPGSYGSAPVYEDLVEAPPAGGRQHRRRFEC